MAKTKTNSEDNLLPAEETYYAVGLMNGIIKTVSNGTHDFAVSTAKHYRSIGYDAKVMKYEDFMDLLDDGEFIG